MWHENSILGLSVVQIAVGGTVILFAFMISLFSYLNAKTQKRIPFRICIRNWGILTFAMYYVGGIFLVICWGISKEFGTIAGAEKIPIWLIQALFSPFILLYRWVTTIII